MISSIISQFDEALQATDPATYNHLQPAASSNQLHDFCEKWNIQNSEFKELYSWKNGNDFDWTMQTNFEISAYGSMLSLHSINYFLTDDQTDEDWKVLDDRNFIPLFREDDRTFILFCKDSGENNGKIFLYCEPLMIYESQLIFNSINDLLLTHIEFYKKAVRRVDRGIKFDRGLLHVIGREMNPNCEFWFG